MLDFQTYENYFKILKTGLNVFKGNYHDIEKQKNITKYQLYTNESKNNRWLLFVISELFVWNRINYFILRSELNVASFRI